jgi:hypothetical protein
MLYVGIDDTDTLDDPGTNQLARHIVRRLAGRFYGRLIVRHQLLDDPRVPYTSKNGCASIWLEPLGAPSTTDLIDELRRMMVDWCPVGSDPGMCVALHVPSVVTEFARRCQRELVSQIQARALAGQCGIHLEGLGGTQDGVIGALAAVGLAATGDDGRVVHLGESAEDLFDIAGIQSVARLRELGIAEIRCPHSSEIITAGLVDVGKRLRPNLRDGKIVLFVAPAEESPAVETGVSDTPTVKTPAWQAVRVI